MIPFTRTHRTGCHLVDTAIGELMLIYSTPPFVLQRVWLPGRHDSGAVRQFDGSAPPSRKLSQLASALRAYGRGTPLPAPWPYISLEQFTALQQRVLIAVAAIPYGQVAAYKDIADAMGRPGAARFVGNTMAHNPWPLLIPCHRVIRNDHRLGQFSSGTNLKRRLLELEGAATVPGGLRLAHNHAIQGTYETIRC